MKNLGRTKRGLLVFEVVVAVSALAFLMSVSAFAVDLTTDDQGIGSDSNVTAGSKMASIGGSNANVEQATNLPETKDSSTQGKDNNSTNGVVGGSMMALVAALTGAVALSKTDKKISDWVSVPEERKKNERDRYAKYLSMLNPGEKPYYTYQQWMEVQAGHYPSQVLEDYKTKKEAERAQYAKYLSTAKPGFAPQYTFQQWLEMKAGHYPSQVLYDIQEREKAEKATGVAGGAGSTIPGTGEQRMTYEDWLKEVTKYRHPSLVGYDDYVKRQRAEGEGSYAPAPEQSPEPSTGSSDGRMSYEDWKTYATGYRHPKLPGYEDFEKRHRDENQPPYAPSPYDN